MGALLKLVAGTVEPAHTVVLEGALATVGVAYTVTLKLVEIPLHPFKVAVTEMVATMFVVVVLVAVKPGALPLPPEIWPVVVLLFVQLKVAPGGTLTKLVATTPTPGHTAILAMAETLGFGYTTM